MKYTINDGIYYDDVIQKNPGKVVIKYLDNSTTYSEFEQRVNKLCTALIYYNVGEQDIVGIYMDNCDDFIVAVVSILRMSAIFVPITTKNPVNRNKYIINNCEPKIIITKVQNSSSLLEFVDTNVRILYIDELSDHVMRNSSLPSHNQLYNEENIAYIIYTSGSTGEPKGVAIRICSLLNYISDTVEKLNFSNDLNTLNTTSFSFDGALTGIFCPLFCRGMLTIRTMPFLRPQKYIDFLCKEKITDIGCSPIQLEMIAKSFDYISDKRQLYLKTIAVGGEELPKKHIEQIINNTPHIRILNRYGPTETTIVASSYEVNIECLQKEQSIPIGKPLKNVAFKVISNQGIEVGAGEVGELIIGGVQVMHSYWKDEELTNQSIIRDANNKKWYKTNDLVTITENGDYVFVGRKDDMVKIYGNRIHLSEIERSLEKINYITIACCLMNEVDEGNKRLYAFVISNKIVSEDNIKKDLSLLVPTYMIPTKIFILPSFPTTINGKIDKNELLLYLREFQNS